jgi:hypothetical protein
MKKRTNQLKIHKKYKALTDVFAKTPSALKVIEDRKAKRLYWKDKNLDAD